MLCLLLGFEGRFAPPLRGEAYRIVERLRGRIETIRAMDYKISPPMEFRTETQVVAPATSDKWKWWVLASLAALLLLFLVYKWTLSWRAGQLEAFLSRSEPVSTATTL